MKRYPRAYEQSIGRITIKAYLPQDGGFQIVCLDGYNDSCQKLYFSLSDEELRDLQYLIKRAQDARKGKR